MAYGASAYGTAVYAGGTAVTDDPTVGRGHDLPMTVEITSRVTTVNHPDRDRYRS